LERKERFTAEDVEVSQRDAKAAVHLGAIAPSAHPLRPLR
jgi:hypothetical protein